MGAGVTPSPPPRQTRTRFFMEAVVITRRPPFSESDLGQSTSPHRTVVTSAAPNIKCKEKHPQIETVDQAMDDLKDDHRGIEFNRNTTSTRCPTSVPVPGPRDMTRPENFLYVNLKVHHLGPRVAGAPGSYFSVTMTENSQDTSLSGLQWVVFSGLAPNNWGYMGLYEMKLGQSMTKDEWLTLPGEVVTFSCCLVLFRLLDHPLVSCEGEHVLMSKKG
ncbi:hypothetical protein BDN72DRAFT_139241 [Pluteus cervinus]|uniref:Uncharacterized protein n=1 Tax=Pluteus cervinus TaxID=181527 RepID=A0ACD3AP05_9AGAR|nr:hypothetical protein BDN72DRAFT_139241 [Pluteus cervinus]